MFGKPSKSVRLENLEEDVDDLWHEMFCDQNPMNINKRLHRLEEFKGSAKDDLNLLFETSGNLIDEVERIDNLYERLGEKVKFVEGKRQEDKSAIQIILIALLKHLGLRLNENENYELEVVKKPKTKKQDAKPLSTPKRTTRKKSK